MVFYFLLLVSLQMFGRGFRLGRSMAAPLATVAAAGAFVSQEQQRQADCGFFGLFGPNLTAVKADIIDIMEKEEEKRGDGTSP